MRPTPAWAVAARVAGRCRWAVDAGAWHPKQENDSKEYQFLLALIPEDAERDAVGKFVHWADRARALCSRLLVRRCSAVCLGLDQTKDVRIARTKGRKPYLVEAAKRKSPLLRDRPNFNFNVSHEGRYVVLAAEPYCVVGVDVAAPDQFRRKAYLREDGSVNVEKFFTSMSNTRRARVSSRSLFARCLSTGPSGDGARTIRPRRCDPPARTIRGGTAASP